MPSIIDIAQQITSNAGVIDNYIKSNGLKPLSWDSDADLEFPNPNNDPTIDAARFALIEDTRKLRDLMLGPTDLMRELSWRQMDISVQRIVFQLKLYEAVPLDGTASYAEIAEKVGLTERQVMLIIRQSALNGVFKEIEPNQVAHTAASAVLLKKESMRNWYNLYTHDTLAVSAKLADALKKYSTSDRPQDSAFSLAFNTDEGYFKYMENFPELQQRFFDGMMSIGQDAGYSAVHIVDGYDWAKWGKASVVDVGGAYGYISVQIAKKFPELTFEVQDYQEFPLEQGQAQLPVEFHNRVSFKQHSFFDVQPTTADVYMLRHICHNWSDANSTKIIKGLVPAMKPTSKILLIDAVVVAPGVVDVMQERYCRNMDVAMLQWLNTQERSIEVWQDIISAADPRLKVLGVYKPTKCLDSIIEVGFEN
ncbi:hypothetical protein ARAM_007096 [Aspergillus rambellii]|uniref:O-methyltransferase C-terminal domain-containing protein n=1 Tax=Aspergillus rambellii TaxID=308745 RepID=A0A0F8V5C9_9EURO|nr:hypothetical protein ARAM_007096 [Aspergillus rambellii]